MNQSQKIRHCQIISSWPLDLNLLAIWSAYTRINGHRLYLPEREHARSGCMHTRIRREGREQSSISTAHQECRHKLCPPRIKQQGWAHWDISTACQLCRNRQFALEIRKEGKFCSNKSISRHLRTQRLFAKYCNWIQNMHMKFLGKSQSPVQTHSLRSSQESLLSKEQRAWGMWAESLNATMPHFQNRIGRPPDQVLHSWRSRPFHANIRYCPHWSYRLTSCPSSRTIIADPEQIKMLCVVLYTKPTHSKIRPTRTRICHLAAHVHGPPRESVLGFKYCIWFLSKACLHNYATYVHIHTTKLLTQIFTPPCHWLRQFTCRAFSHQNATHSAKNLSISCPHSSAACALA